MQRRTSKKWAAAALAVIPLALVNTVYAGAMTRRLADTRVSMTVHQSADFTSRLALGQDVTAVIGDDGKLYTWGDNTDGVLGDGTQTDRVTPEAVPGLNHVVSVSISDNNLPTCLAVTSDGTVWGWGENSGLMLGLLPPSPEEASLGSKYALEVHSPVQIQGLQHVVSVSAGSDHLLALTADGHVWAYGSNDEGQLGTGTISGSTTPVPVEVPGLDHVVQVAAGQGFSVALKADGTVWAWGVDMLRTANVTVPAYGGGPKSNPSPVQVPGLSGVAAIAVGEHVVFALKRDGTVWLWGDDYSHFPCRNQGRTIDEPQQALGVRNVVQIAVGSDFALALERDGSVWSWGGFNNFGEMGFPGMFFVPSFIRIPGLEHIRAVAAGGYHAYALAADGTVYGWGSDFKGELGDGESWMPLGLHSPTQIYGASSYNKADHTKPAPISAFAVKLTGNWPDFGGTSTGRPAQKSNTNAIQWFGITASAKHTRAQLLQAWQKDRPVFSGSPYTVKPSAKFPYVAGSLKAGYLKDGLHMANFVRFVAGLPDDLVLDAQLDNLAQHGAVVEAANGALSHFPRQPQRMPLSFFQLGQQSAGSSNLFEGPFTLPYQVLSYMDDSDPMNISRVGHRRWILNPPLHRVGFGQADSPSGITFGVMQVFDQSRTAPVNYVAVAWPSAGLFPLTLPNGTPLFSAPEAWSISLNPSRFAPPQAGSIQVTLTRLKDHKVWRLSAVNQKDGYFTVDNNGYGIPNAIIFQPQHITYHPGDTFAVHVSGLITLDGRATTLDYKVTFIAL